MLPRTPSKLIRLALADLAKCEEDPRYKVHMGEWHEPKGGVCSVCLAGSVIAQTIGTLPVVSCIPCFFDDEEMTLIALDALRNGDVSDAFDDLGLGESPIDDREITPYEDDHERFRTDMEELANDLEKAGL